MVVRGLLLKPLFPPGLVSCLGYQWLSSKLEIIIISSFEDNHPSGNFKVKHPLKALCWNVNENCDVYVAIDRVDYQSKKNSRQKLLFRFSLYLTTLTSVYLYSSCFTAYAANVNSERENTIHRLFAGTCVSSREITGSSEQRTAFTRAESVILQSRNFNLRGEDTKNSLFTKLISQKRVR